MQKNILHLKNLCAIAVALLLLATSCANKTLVEGEEVEDETKAPALLLEYTRSGGLVGYYDHLVIMDDGAVSLKRKNKAEEFTIGENEIKGLRALLKDCYPDAPEKVKPGDPVLVMADYVTCTFKTPDQEFSYNDIKMPERIRKLVEEINTRYINRVPQ